MKKSPHWKFFVKMANFWMGRLGFDKPIEIKRDNRLDCPCMIRIEATDTELQNITKYTLVYNSRRLGQRPLYVNLSDMFHEIGHLQERLPYNTLEEKVVSEYAAELYSVEIMKKEYLKLFKNLIKYLAVKQSMFKLFKKERIYYEAYVKIPEYRKTISEINQRKINKILKRNMK